MINVTKSQPAPTCLVEEKRKSNGDYKCGDVLPRLQEDFRNKCYICEQLAPVTINIEHFIAHQGDIDLKFDWMNLFLSCGHCNNVKLARYNHLLNCTNPEHRVDEWIEYEMRPYPKEKVRIVALVDNDATNSTVELLNRVYNGHTDLKTIEAANIRQKILAELYDFQKYLQEYFTPGIKDEEKKAAHRKIERHLNPYSNFTAFKRWVVRRNEDFLKEFGDLIKHD